VSSGPVRITQVRRSESEWEQSLCEGDTEWWEWEVSQGLVWFVFGPRTRI